MNALDEAARGCEMSGWVLQDGKHFYRSWVAGFGPMCTSKVGEAHVFSSREEAVQSLAFRFRLMNFLPVGVEELTAATLAPEPEPGTRLETGDVVELGGQLCIVVEAGDLGTFGLDEGGQYRYVPHETPKAPQSYALETAKRLRNLARLHARGAKCSR